MRFSDPVLVVIVCFALIPVAKAQFMDDTPDTPAPAQKGVEPVIPLNTEDPAYDLWKLRRDDLSEGRDPGPIDIERFSGGTGWNGIPTFFRHSTSMSSIRPTRLGQARRSPAG